MKELSKSIPRRLLDSRYISRYFVGSGIDIGGKPDPLSLYKEFFPLLTDVRIWDLEDGDAEFMSSVPDSQYDFVHSSHTLEHLNDPNRAFSNWLRIIKPEGHMIVTVPDEDLYEQGNFTDKFNRHHKWTFTIWKKETWSKNSINVFDLVESLGEKVEVKSIALQDATYRYQLPRYDQTRTPIAECAIEIILRKRSDSEMEFGGRAPNKSGFPDGTELYFKQYVRDQLAAAEKFPAPFGTTK